MSSLTLCAGTAGCTTSTLLVAAMLVTAAKSRAVSNGSFSYNAAAMVSGGVAINKV